MPLSVPRPSFVEMFLAFHVGKKICTSER